MNRVLFLITFFSAATGAYAQNPTVNAELCKTEYTVEQRLAEYVVPLDSFDEAPVLDSVLSGRRIVALGEAAHADSPLIEAKAALTEYLYLNGFGTLGMEAGSFISSYVYCNPRYGHVTADWDPDWLISMPGNNYDAFAPVARLVRDKKVKLFGIDIYPYGYDTYAAAFIFNTCNPDGRIGTEFWQELYAAQAALSNASRERKSVQDSLIVRVGSLLDRLDNRTITAMELHPQEKDLRAVRQWIRNMRTYLAVYPYLTNPDLSADPQAVSVFNNLRDAQMAENVQWWAGMFPEERMILWCASFHAARSIGQAEYLPDQTMYVCTRLLGEHLYDRFGNQFYSLAFIDDKQPRPIFESAVADRIVERYGFVDFYPLRFDERFAESPFECGAVGTKTGNWIWIWDGMLFFRR